MNRHAVYSFLTLCTYGCAGSTGISQNLCQKRAKNGHVIVWRRKQPCMKQFFIRTRCFVSFAKLDHGTGFVIRFVLILLLVSDSLILNTILNSLISQQLLDIICQIYGLPSSLLECNDLVLRVDDIFNMSSSKWQIKQILI